MQHSLNGTLSFGNGQTALISRERDFRELLELSPAQTLFKVCEALKTVCAGLGELRSPAADLYRQRLAQVRKHLRA